MCLPIRCNLAEFHICNHASFVMSGSSSTKHASQKSRDVRQAALVRKDLQSITIMITSVCKEAQVNFDNNISPDL